MATAAAAAQNQRLPFRMNTRQRMQRVQGGAVSLGSRQSIELPRVGFLAAVFLLVSGDVTIAAGTMSDLGPWNLVQRLQLSTNVGAATLYDTSGYGNYLVQNHMSMGVRGDSDSAGNATNGAAELYQFATGADGVRLMYHIPVAANDGTQFSLGLLNLQAPEVRVALDVQWASAITDVHSGASAPSLTYEVAYLYYEVPSQQKVKWPPLILHRIMEDIQPVSQTGDQIYTVPRQGTLMQLVHLLSLNGARNTADVETLRLRINKTDDVYNIPAEFYPWLHTQRYGRLPSVGEFTWDFWHADVVPNASDMRDAIDSESISTLESIVDVASGATLGSGNNFLRSIRRIAQPIQL